MLCGHLGGLILSIDLLLRIILAVTLSPLPEIIVLISRSDPALSDLARVQRCALFPKTAEVYCCTESPSSFFDVIVGEHRTLGRRALAMLPPYVV